MMFSKVSSDVFDFDELEFLRTLHLKVAAAIELLVKFDCFLVRDV